MIRKRWRETSFEAWNARARERGYHYAILPEPPFRKRLHSLVRTAIIDVRECLARRLAPWLIEDE